MVIRGNELFDLKVNGGIFWTHSNIRNVSMMDWIEHGPELDEHTYM